MSFATYIAAYPGALLLIGLVVYFAVVRNEKQ